ncbi:MAG: Clp protease N-terminal domain-containing protein [Acidobacteriaceae bacterium]|jgi:ATP-dependent Clp protease ATP-binding subunit ClpC
MFEKYTEKARRVIFFARYEASQFGQPYIEAEHLLLGLLREDKALTNRFLRSSHASVEVIRRRIEAHTTIRESISTSVDLPLSNESKHVLSYAGEEAVQMGHKHVGTEHLLLGLLREEKCFAAQILHERGLRLLAVREEVAKMPEQPAVRSPESSPAELFTDLVQSAMAGRLEPVVGRDLELENIIEILCSRDNRNPLLIGDPGVGKNAIVEGLAHRIAHGHVPELLANKRILVLEPGLVAGWANARQKFEELTKLVGSRANPSEVILLVDEVQNLVASPSKAAAPDGTKIVERALLYNGIQCVGVMNASDYRERTEAAPWFGKYFRAVYVRGFDQEETLRVLVARKSGLESFHQVTYAAEALEFAVHASDSYLPERSLPAKAVELLDAAGSLVKLRQAAPPDEVAEAEKRVRFIAQRLESAIANHEFEKARHYSDAERNERENLNTLRVKYHLGEPSSALVGRDDVQQVISRWSAYPYRP